MNGLYALKTWYTHRLACVRHALVRRGVAPGAVTATGVVCGAAAGGTFLILPPGPAAAGLVGLLLAARLACANLDGGVARDSGRSTRFGAVVNEVGDRLAELAALAGLLVLAPTAAVALVAVAGSTPSWISLAGAAAGSDRIQGGPVGKTERCLILVAIAATGWVVPLLIAYGVGSLATGALRLAWVRRALAEIPGPVASC